MKKLIRTKPLTALEYSLPKDALGRRISDGDFSLQEGVPSNLQPPINIRNSSGYAESTIYAAQGHGIPPEFYESRVSEAEEQLQLSVQRSGSLLNSTTVLYRHTVSAPHPFSRAFVPLQRISVDLFWYTVCQIFNACQQLRSLF